MQNEVEANLVYHVAETLLRSGVAPEEIGVISVYRQQLKLLGHLLSDRKGIEFLTADRSQGRDKECIIISMVRSNDTGFVRLLRFCLVNVTHWCCSRSGISSRTGGG